MKKILLVIEREFITRVKKKSFIIMTILVPVLFAGLMIVSTLLKDIKSDKEKKIAVFDETGKIGHELVDIGTMKFEVANKSLDELKKELQNENYYAILSVENGDSARTVGNLMLISQKAIGMDVQETVKVQLKKIVEKIELQKYDISPEVLAILQQELNFKTILLDESGDEKESHTAALMGLAMICGIIIFFIVFMFGVQIMRSVIEEKSNRIIEIIISSIKPIQLMLGKIIGVALVVITQMLIWIVVIGIILIIGESQFAEQIAVIKSYIHGVPVGTLLTCFIIYLILGYLLYASLFAAVGSAADNETDTQQLQTIVTVPIMIGYFVMIIVSMNPENPLAFWTSMIPFTSPMVMLARIPYGVPAWEIALSIALLIATFILITWVAARIYRVGILMYGKKASFKELIKWMRYKN
jgi:ABC-type Na+ efflux pump, permease component